jgi:predicted SnoaL-like aldol condensation-catalyzing enzyme
MSPKTIAVSIFELGFRDHQIAEAFRKFVAPTYVQRNPRLADAEATVKFLESRFRDKPDATYRIVRVVAEGDIVAIHSPSKLSPEDRGNAIVDIYRIADGRIVERWDVIQPIPETSANSSTMF